MLNWMSIVRCNQGWNEELTWATMHENGKKLEVEVYIMVLAAVVYYIWKEINHKTF